MNSIGLNSSIQYFRSGHFFLDIQYNISWQTFSIWFSHMVTCIGNQWSRRWDSPWQLQGPTGANQSLQPLGTPHNLTRSRIGISRLLGPPWNLTVTVFRKLNIRPRLATFKVMLFIIFFNPSLCIVHAFQMIVILQQN